MLAKVLAASAAAAFALSACARDPSHIEASYISPLAYDDYSCAQIADEAQRISARAAEATGQQKKNATNDAVAMGVGLIVFWPALFFIKGGSSTEAEVARLKGEKDAIEEASIRKNCGIQFQQGAPPQGTIAAAPPAAGKSPSTATALDLPDPIPQPKTANPYLKQ